MVSANATTLAAETARWRAGFQVVNEVTAKGAPKLQDPALKTLQMLDWPVIGYYQLD